MKVRMLVTQMGAGDDRGLEVQRHESGRSYDLPDTLDEVYLAEGWAELDKAMPRPPETKVEAPPTTTPVDVEPEREPVRRGRTRKAVD